MKKTFSIKSFHLLLIVIIAALIGYYVGVTAIRVEWKNYTPVLSVASKNPPPGTDLDMKLFYDVLTQVNRKYYDKSKVDSKKILYGAISGMLQSLEDPYTSFFPPKENTSFKTQLSGQFEGIGAELGTSPDNRIIVISPLDNSPAQKAGIKSGDIILKVDGKDTNGWTLPQAVEKIRGPHGSSVMLTIAHEGSKSPQDVAITRDVIVVKSVSSWVKDVMCSGNSCQTKENCADCSQVAYIRLSQFGDRTEEEWTQAIDAILAKSDKSRLKGVVLDVRNNPGGYLREAVYIASEFLRGGVVVKQEDNEGAVVDLRVSRQGKLLDVPLIVLINKGSASASEIVAGALSDNKRAELLGEKSFGKGTIQEAVDVDTGASVHVSVARWLTPNGTWVHQKGLTPDVEVKLDSSKTDPKGLDNQLQAAVKELINK